MRYTVVEMYNQSIRLDYDKLADYTLHEANIPINPIDYHFNGCYPFYRALTNLVDKLTLFEKNVLALKFGDEQSRTVATKIFASKSKKDLNESTQ